MYYTINVKGHCGGFDFTKYTFNDVKNYFTYDLEQVEPENIEYFKKLNKEIESAIDIDDLKDILTKQCEGMEFLYEIEPY